jgi:hypothetical protein
MLARLRIEAELLKNFGPKGKAIYQMADGKASNIMLAKQLKAGFPFVDKVLSFLAGAKAVSLRPLAMDEVKRHYGEEGGAICELYGREGLLIYELIDKKMTIREIIVASGVEPRKAVEILAFIHKLLGVDIHFDKEALLSALGKEGYGPSKPGAP